MQILAIETATNACSVALLSDNGLEFAEDNSVNSHTQSVLPMIDSLLADTDFTLDDLDAVAYDAGPGSFTGLRIGAGVTQGLAYAKNLPIINISSLEAMALQANVDYAAVALDARMNEIYFATFVRKSNMVFEILNQPQLLKPELVKLDKTKKWCLVGNGWQAYESRFSRVIMLSYSAQNSILPHAREIAQLAQYGDKQIAHEALPVYLRAAI